MTTPVANGPSFSRTFVGAITRYPEREAFVTGDSRLTYAQCADMISRFQQVLQAQGVGDDATMVVLSPNAPEAYLAQVAGGLNGCRYSGLHPLGSVEDHVSLCDDADATVLLVHPSYAETAVAIADQAGSIATVLTLGPADIGEDLLALAADLTPKPLVSPPASPEDIVWMPYTGGTTGRSKGVMHTHQSMVNGVLGISSAWELPSVPRYLACAPITHASVLPILPTFTRGGTVVLMTKFDPHAWLDTVIRERINYTFMVPTMLYTLLDNTDVAERQLDALETITYGSAPMAANRLSEALDAFGPVLMQGYGQTETLGLGTTLRKDEHDPVNRPELLSSCGRPVPGLLVDVLDDDHQVVDDGDVGEVCMKGGCIMTGYYKQPSVTDNALRPDGWLHTGDLARRDEQGYLHLVDRKKDLIISGAFNIYPSEIEEVLAAHPDVSSVAVVGLPDDKWGEAVTAFVVPRPGSKVDTEQLRLEVRKRKGAHQAPKQIHVVTGLPTTAVGKIDKKSLRARHWEGQSRGIN